MDECHEVPSRSRAGLFVDERRAFINHTLHTGFDVIDLETHMVKAFSAAGQELAYRGVLGLGLQQLQVAVTHRKEQNGYFHLGDIATLTPLESEKPPEPDRRLFQVSNRYSQMVNFHESAPRIEYRLEIS
jgi:hypothetical protein